MLVHYRIGKGWVKRGPEVATTPEGIEYRLGARTVHAKTREQIREWARLFKLDHPNLTEVTITGPSAVRVANALARGELFPPVPIEMKEVQYAETYTERISLRLPVRRNY